MGRDDAPKTPIGHETVAPKIARILAAIGHETVANWAIISSRYKTGRVFRRVWRHRRGDAQQFLAFGERVPLARAFGRTGRAWLPALDRNQDVPIDHRCICSRSGAEMTFHEADAGEYSTLSDYVNADRRMARRINGRHYTVETVSLTNLLLAQLHTPTRENPRAFAAKRV